MLEGLKWGGAKSARQQAEELQALVDASKEERAALSTMLTQIQLQSAKLATAGKALQEVEDAAGRAHLRLDEVTARLDSADRRAGELEAVEGRIQVLADAVAKAETETATLTSPDGELQKHKLALQNLSSQALQTRASIDALKKDQTGFDDLREQIHQARTDVKASSDRADKLAAEFDELRALSGQLSQDYGRLKESSRETHEEANATVELVREAEKKLGPLTQVQELTRTTEERMTALNALAEHVGQKVKALENQKHTVEHAVIEANRLNEMVWSMELQINKLNETSRQATRTEELVDRVEKLAREVGAQLDNGVRARDAFTGDLARLDRDRAALVEFVRSYTDRLGVERREFETFEQRMKALQGSVADAEKAMEALATRDRLAASMSQRVDQLAKQLQTLTSQAEELQRQQSAVEALQESLTQVDQLAKRTDWQYEHLKQSRQDLDAIRADIQEFYKSHAQAAQLRDRLSLDRTALEGFIERTASFTAALPELDTRMNAISAKLSLVDDGTQKAVNLVAIVDDLDRQMARVTTQQQIVERVESRVNALNVLAGDVDRKLQDQLGRRAEVDALRTQLDAIVLQVADAQQKLEAVSELQAKLLPLLGQHSTLKSQIEKVHARLMAVQQEDATLADQERRLSELLASNRAIAAEAGERVKQVQGLAAEVGRSSAMKDELLQELARVQSRQREVGTQLETAEDQLKRLEAAARQLDQRRTQLAFSEKRIAAFELKLAELAQMAGDIDAKLQGLAERGAIVEAVRNEVGGVHEISARSKADLQYVEAHRSDVAMLRTRVDEVLASIGETETRLAAIEARKKFVEEVQVKTGIITNMLEDVRLNLETVGEHRAVMDHVMESVTRLNEKLQEAQTTLKALQAERELAEKIERGVKHARRTPQKSPPAEEVKRLA